VRNTIDKPLNYLTGQVMKLSKGTAHGDEIKERIRKRLDNEIIEEVVEEYFSSKKETCIKCGIAQLPKFIENGKCCFGDCKE